MQLTIDIDKHFIDNLKEEFHTTNVKDALSQLLDFYKQSHTLKNNLNHEIMTRVLHYKDGSLHTTHFDHQLAPIRDMILNKL